MRLNREMLLDSLADRLTTWWTYPDNIVFEPNTHKINIYQDYTFIGSIRLAPKPTISLLKETRLSSLVRFHILRILGCSIRPTTIEFIFVQENRGCRLPASADPLCSPDKELAFQWN